MDEQSFYKTLDICRKIIKANVENPETRLDFDSKVYAEGIRQDLLTMKKYLKKDSKVLDIGCGKGHLTVLISLLNFSAEGIDLEETLGEQLGTVEKRRKWTEKIWREFEAKFEVKFSFYDGEKIPAEKNGFDAVVAYAAIEHVQQGALDNLLWEIKRVLKLGGYFFIFRCPRKYAFVERLASFLNIPHHEKLLDESELRKLIEEYNFEVLSIERTDIVPSFPPQRLQFFWNLMYPALYGIELILSKTPLSYFSHHLRMVAKRNT